MSNDSEQASAFGKVVDDELYTIVKVLEAAGPGKHIYVYVVAVDPPLKNDDGDIEYNAVMHRWHSDDMLQSHARLVKTALERELERLRKAIES